MGARVAGRAGNLARVGPDQHAAAAFPAHGRAGGVEFGAVEALGEAEVGQAEAGAAGAREEEGGGLEVAVHDDRVAVVEVAQGRQDVQAPLSHLWGSQSACEPGRNLESGEKSRTKFASDETNRAFALPRSKP